MESDDKSLIKTSRNKYRATIAANQARLVKHKLVYDRAIVYAYTDESDMVVAEMETLKNKRPTTKKTDSFGNTICRVRSDYLDNKHNDESQN